jgi:CRP-like cAMP-binding protein
MIPEGISRFFSKTFINTITGDRTMNEPVNRLTSIVGTLTVSGLGVDLTKEELQQVANLAEVLEFKKGARILEENSVSRDLYIIQEGTVSVRMDIPAIYKFEEIIARENHCEIFGELAFISGERRSASIQAETKVTLLQIRYDSLMALFAESPIIGYKIMRNIAVIVTKRIAERNKMLRKSLFYH